MRKTLLAGIVLLFLAAGCVAAPTQKESANENTVPAPENQCEDCRLVCPPNSSSQCVNNTCVCTSSGPPSGENQCEDCRIDCPNATRTACVNNACQCFYDEQPSEQAAPATPTNAPANEPSFLDTLPSCGEKMDYLSIPPLEYDDFELIVPLGNLNPSGHTFPTDHIYMLIESEYQQGSPVRSVPLRMPADAWITEITASKHLNKSPPFEDYDLIFHVCKELSFRFGHVSSLSTEIKSQYDAQEECDPPYETGGQTYQRCASRDLAIQVTKGDQMGTIGGNVNQNGFDVWGYDTRAEPLNDANPERWRSPHFSIVCPLDYFTSAEKQRLYTYVGGFDGDNRTIEPICGTIEQDILGTAQGIWFVEGTTNTYPEDPHLALVLHNVDPRINVFSIGTSVPGIESGTYSFTPETSGNVNIAFASVRPGTTYCYEPIGENFTILVKMTDEKTLTIKKASGACGNNPSLTGGTTFER